MVIEITSQSTKEEDLDDKFALYRDTLQVPEYFLFDPQSEFLAPSLQGFRLQKGRYVPIKAVKGRLPSKSLRLHLERDGWQLRLYDPKTQQRLLTPTERAELAEAEVEKLRAELAALRRGEPNP